MGVKLVSRRLLALLGFLPFSLGCRIGIAERNHLDRVLLFRRLCPIQSVSNGLGVFISNRLFQPGNGVVLSQKRFDLLGNAVEYLAEGLDLLDKIGLDVDGFKRC